MNELEELFEAEIYRFLPERDREKIDENYWDKKIYNEFFQDFYNDMTSKEEFIACIKEEAQGLADVIHDEINKCCAKGCRACLE